MYRPSEYVSVTFRVFLNICLKKKKKKHNWAKTCWIFSSWKCRPCLSAGNCALLHLVLEMPFYYTIVDSFHAGRVIVLPSLGLRLVGLDMGTWPGLPVGSPHRLISVFYIALFVAKVLIWKRSKMANGHLSCLFSWKKKGGFFGRGWCGRDGRKIERKWEQKNDRGRWKGIKGEGLGMESY